MSAFVTKAYFRSGVSNLRLTGHRQPRMAMNAARHKVVHLLKHYENFLWLRVTMSHKINVHTLLLFVPVHGFSFTAVCDFQCVIFQRADNKIDIIRRYMCSWRLSEAAMINNTSTYHCNVRHLMLFRSQVTILIWLLKVLSHVSSTSHVTATLYRQHPTSPGTGSQDGCGRAQTLLSVFLQINFHNKSK